MNLLSAFTRSRRAFFSSVGLLALAGLGLRLFRLTNQSFWIDEIVSITTARGPLGGIYERSALSSNSPPTFFLLLRLFVGDSGTDLEFRARLLSVIAGALSVPVFIGVVYFWRRQRGTALLAGLLLAVNPLHLWYSQEVRGYAIMLLFGLLTLLSFELAREKRRPGWWALYALCAFTTIAMHKTGLIFAAACGLWHAWDVYRRQLRFQSLLAHLPVAAAAVIVLLLKSYPPPEGYGRSASGLEIGYTFLTFLGGYSFGPSVTDIQSYGPLGAISRHAVETGILLAVLLALALAVASGLRRVISGREIQLMFLGIGVVSIYALFSGFPYNVRYALPALFGFLALAAALAAEPEKSSCARLSVAALLVVALWADGQWFYGPAYRKDDCRAVANWLVQNRERVHSWTVLPEYMNAPIEWYLHLNPEVLAGKVPPASDRTTTFPPVPDVLILSRRHHLLNPDQLIAAYGSAAGGAHTNSAFTGFEIYVADVPKGRAGAAGAYRVP